jgi:dual specificity phosphatase 12
MAMVLCLTQTCLRSFQEHLVIPGLLRQELHVVGSDARCAGQLVSILAVKFGLKKVIRQDLATREHMLDHGQLGPPTPAVAFTPASSRRSSMNDTQQPRSRRPSINVTVSRRPSAGQLPPRANSRGDNGPLPLTNFGRGLSDQLSMSALDTDSDDQISSSPQRPSAGQRARSRVNSLGENSPLSLADLGRGLSDSLSMSALDTDDDQTIIAAARRPSAGQARSRVNSKGDNRPSVLTGFGRGISDSLSMSALDTDDDDNHHVDASHVKVRSRVSSTSDNRPTRPSPLHENSDPIPENAAESVEGLCSPASVVVSVPAVTPHSSSTLFANPTDLAAQLDSHPKLAELRSPRLISQVQAIVSPISLPILVNPKCSGYFVEPVS